MNNSSKLILIGSNLVLASKLRSLNGCEIEIIKPQSLNLDFNLDAQPNDTRRLALFDLEACRKEELLDKAIAIADRCRELQIETVAFYPHVYSEYQELENSFDKLIVKGSVVQVLKKLLATNPQTEPL